MNFLLTLLCSIFLCSSPKNLKGVDNLENKPTYQVKKKFCIPLPACFGSTKNHRFDSTPYMKTITATVTPEEQIRFSISGHTIDPLFKGCQSSKECWARLAAKQSAYTLGGQSDILESIGKSLPKPEHCYWIRKLLEPNPKILSLFSGTALWEYMLFVEEFDIVSTNVDDQATHMNVTLIDPLEALERYPERDVLFTHFPPQDFPILKLIQQFRGDWWIHIDCDNTNDLSMPLWKKVDRRNDVETLDPNKKAIIILYQRQNF